jgi:hypothetical protein
VPSDWKVIVSAERGLYARWLYEDIISLGWHPYTRLQNPESAERHWLAMSVALIWILTYGGGRSTLSEDRETETLNAISAL